MVRPLALPLLNRLQARVASAVDASALAAELRGRMSQVEGKLAAVEDQALAMSARLAHIETISEGQLATLAQLNALAEDARHRLKVLVEEACRPVRIGTLPLGEQEILVRGPDGWLLAPREDVRLVAALAETGARLEPGTREVLRALLSPGDFAVDVGAHIGLHSLAMARAVAPSGRVLAVEPNPRLADLLERNLDLNGLAPLARVARCAAGASDGVATLSVGAVLGEGTLLDSAQPGTIAIETPVRTLDDLLAEFSPPTVVKIDVEGYELAVLAGMRGLLEGNDLLAVVAEFGPSHVTKAGSSREAWLQAFLSAGFEGWRIEETGTAGLLRPLRREGLDDVVSVNLLFLRGPLASWPTLARLAS